jgi:hypothetical protein
MTARYEISRLAPSHADPFQSTAGWLAMPKGFAHFWRGTAMERWTEPEP